MRRALPVALSIALLALLLPTATLPAEGVPPRFEALAAEFEMLFFELLGEHDSEPVFKAHGQGLYSMTLELSEQERERLLARSGTAKQLNALRNGNCMSTPSSARSLINAVLASTYVDYNFWFVAVNLSSFDKVKRTINTIKGPGLSYKRTDNLRYPAAAIQTYWFEVRDVFQEDGIFTFKTKISAGGAIKGKAFAM